jgi:hypothetical protein
MGNEINQIRPYMALQPNGAAPLYFTLKSNKKLKRMRSALLEKLKKTSLIKCAGKVFVSVTYA